MNLVDPFLWLSQQTSGIFILRVFTVKYVDHCVVVNTSEKVKIYSAEEKHLMFSIDILKICGGSDV